MAITWRDIRNNGGFAEASRILETARGSFNEGASFLNKALEQWQANQLAQANNVRDQNLSNYKDFLAGFRTVDDLMSAQSSGLLDQQLARYGNRIDRDAVRPLFDERLAALRNQTREAITFQNELARHNEQETRNRIALLQSQGRHDEANALIAGLQTDNTDVVKSGMDALTTLNKERRLDDRLRIDQDVNRRANEVQGWDRTRFEQEQEDYKQRMRANDLVNQTILNRANQEQKNYEIMRDVASQMRVPMDSSGNPIIENIPGDQLQAFYNELLNAGFRNTMTDTQTANTVLEQALKSGIRPEYALAALGSSNQVISASQTLSPTDQARVEARRQQLAEAAKSNFFLQDIGKDMAQEALRIVDKYTDKETGYFLGETDNEDRDRYIRDLQSALINGVEIDGELVPVPVALVEQAVASVKANLPDFDGNLEEIIQDQIAELLSKGSRVERGGPQNRPRTVRDPEAASKYREQMEEAIRIRKEDQELNAAAIGKFLRPLNSNGLLERFEAELRRRQNP